MTRITCLALFAAFSNSAVAGSSVWLPDAVAVDISGAVVAGAEVDGVAGAVAVAVIVCVKRADVAGIAHSVSVRVCLIDVCDRGAVVRRISHSVSVGVGAAHYDV